MTTKETNEPVTSVAEITFKDGSRTEFTVNASPAIVPNLVRDMVKTGYLTLWNDSETMSITASEIRSFVIEQLTDEE